MKKNILIIITSLIAVFSIITSNTVLGKVVERGIYINQSTIENKQKLTYLIKRAKAVGINTFIVDMHRSSKAYANNIKLVKEAGLKYVARVVIFPGGGTAQHIFSVPYREKKLKLMEAAINYGADAIQLDYIRYSSKQAASPQNSKDILGVIKWFKNKIAGYNVPLQIDVFGETSYYESKHIGQNVPLFSSSVDVVCPMVYPSHFEPFAKHSKQPYETVYNALIAMQKQFKGAMPFKLIPFIETSNYHYKISARELINYMHRQIKAVENANGHGWYFWSANNHYDNLFELLGRTHKTLISSK